MNIHEGKVKVPTIIFGQLVANTLAKWKKLEPDEINYSQKVVSTSCFVFNSLPAKGDLLSADNHSKQFGPRSGLTKCWA